MLRILHLVCDYFFQLFLVCNMEWQLSGQQFVNHNSQSPNINFVVVGFSHQKLRRNIQWGTTKCLSFLILRIHTPPKITQLGQFKTHDDVFWFDISMNNVLRMKIAETFAYIFNYRNSLFLFEFLFSFQKSIQLSFNAVFNQEVNIFSIIEKSVHSDAI